FDGLWWGKAGMGGRSGPTNKGPRASLRNSGATPLPIPPPQEGEGMSRHSILLTRATRIIPEDSCVTNAFQPRSDFLRGMQERGYIHQCSDLQGLDDKARSGSLVGYIGFDATAPSLHVGSLVQIMMLHWLQETGGKPVALMGGGTTMVGDPSGKDESRKLLTVEAIEANKAGIRKAFAHFIRFGEGKTDAVMPDNADWLARLNYIDFLREVGRHFSVNRMLAMDSVRLRLDREHELTFL